ncbi:methylenetetrahydrofolate reductase, partial [Mycobacteroides abscessus]|uniref:methylenetetrahydrofolate reductase n=1 Tax=Mycobacteroides abscessus TaxID=36809 RepID=UPI000A418FB6
MTTNPLDRDGPVAELQDPGSIADRLTAVQPGEIAFSVEFMPPRDEAAEARLWRAARVFERYRPVFVSVTYGAGAVS